MNLHNVLVMKIRSDTSFIEEHSDESLIFGVLRTNTFEHNVALEPLNTFRPP